MKILPVRLTQRFLSVEFIWNLYGFLSVFWRFVLQNNFWDVVALLIKICFRQVMVFAPSLKMVVA